MESEEEYVIRKVREELERAKEAKKKASE